MYRDPRAVPPATVKDQYERYPFPPLSLGAMENVRPCQAEYAFAHHYQRGCAPQTRAPRILDAGCGTGISSLKLAELNPQAQIVAIELSEAALGIARQRLKRAGLAQKVTFLQGDLQDPQCVRKLTEHAGGRFDYVHCSGVIHHIPQPHLALRHIRQCLQPDALGFFMVYAGAARHEIHTLQALMDLVWDEQVPWEKALQRCRDVLEQLPVTHPLKQFHLRTRNTVKHLLGEAVADSDAFLVDTYLQRCEHRWTRQDWYEYLQNSGFEPGRWLDESSWELDTYLPGYAAAHHVSPATQLAMAEMLRPPHNFAHFVRLSGAPAQTTSRVFEGTYEIPTPFACIQAQPQNQGAIVNNQLGQQLHLTDWEYNLWQNLDGQRTCQALCQAQHQKTPHISLSDMQESLRRWVQYFCIGWTI